MGDLISEDHFTSAVRMQCTNATCELADADGSVWMHDVCFEKFEDHALTSLQKTGRARNWTNTQAIANLWTKKGYDVVIKSCGCACDNGFIRKDLDYRPPKIQAEQAAEAAKPKKKKDTKDDKSTKDAEKKAKKVARKLMEEEEYEEGQEVEYFDRPGSMTLGAALMEKTEAQMEAEKKANADKQRMLAKQQADDERNQREALMARREKERQDQEKAEKRRKEAERREAVERAQRDEEEKIRKAKEAEEKKRMQREKQKERDAEKKAAEKKMEDEARARRKKFEAQQAMKTDQDAQAAQEVLVADLEAGQNGEDGDDEVDEEYRRELLKSMRVAEAIERGEPPPTDDDALFWSEPQAAPTGNRMPPGFTDMDMGSFDADAQGAGHSSGKAAQITKLRAQVKSLQENLSRVLAEVQCEQKLRMCEDERLERVKASIAQRNQEMSLFSQRWGDQIRSLV